MSFDQILRRSELANDGRNWEIAGLAFYYLEQYEDREGASTSEVRNIIEKSRIALSGGSVSSAVQRLRTKEWLTPIDASKRYPDYRLTFDGINHYKELLSDGESQEETREEKFIATDVVEVDYYESLVQGINKSYEHGINDGSLVLTRKLFENLIIDILRAEFGGNGIDLYFNTNNRQFHGLSTLCSNLRSKIPDLDHYSRQLDDGLIDQVEEFKERGNSQAHSVRVNISDEEIEGMADDATRLTEVLYEIREEVRIANG